MVRPFDQHFSGLRHELLRMGAAVEESVEQAVRALTERDMGLIDAVLAGGRRIDDWEIRIEEQCLRLLATQSPVASDMRALATAIKINVDLERINDHAVNIAQRAAALNRLPLLKPLIDIPRMAAAAQGMVHDALDAFVDRDAPRCRQIAQRDEVVDALRDQVFRDLLTHMRSPGGHELVDRAIQLILVSRDLERIGDYASDIAENVVFMVEGRIVRHQKQAWWDEADGPDAAHPEAR